MKWVRNCIKLKTKIWNKVAEEMKSQSSLSAFKKEVNQWVRVGYAKSIYIK